MKHLRVSELLTQQAQQEHGREKTFYPERRWEGTGVPQLKLLVEALSR